MEEKPQISDIRRDLVALLPQLRRFALTLTVDTTSADGLVSAACEKAIHKSHMWKKDRRLEVWLFAIMHAMWLDDKKKRRAALKQRGEAIVLPMDTQENTTAYAILDGLSDGLAPVFLLCAVEGLSYREAASILGETQDAIAMRLAIARDELATLMNRHLERRA